MKTVEAIEERIDELSDDSSKTSNVARETLEDIVKHMREDVWGPPEILVYAQTSLEVTGGIMGALIAASCAWVLEIPGTEFMNNYPLHFTFEHITPTSNIVRGYTISSTPPVNPMDDRLRTLWRAIKSRCRKENIVFYEKWHDYETFATSVGPRLPHKRLTRIDTKAGYIPGNLEWR